MRARFLNAPNPPGGFETVRGGCWVEIDWDKKPLTGYTPIEFCAYCKRVALNWASWRASRRNRWARPACDAPRRMDFWPIDAFANPHDLQQCDWCCSSCGSHPVTLVACCDICGVIGEDKPTRVHYRSDVYSWNRDGPHDYTTTPKNTLCVGCRNKARSILRQKRELDECRLLVTRLRRTTPTPRPAGIAA